MSGDSQPVADRNVDGAILGMMFVWLGFTLSLAIMILTMIGVVLFSLDSPIIDLPELGYLLLLTVPIGLLGAILLAPKLAPKDPADVVRKAESISQYPAWQGTTEADPYYWLPLYQSQYFIRMGILEGAGATCTVGFLLTSDYLVLGGALIMLAVLMTQMPTRAKFDDWVAKAREQRDLARLSE